MGKEGDGEKEIKMLIPLFILSPFLLTK